MSRMCLCGQEPRRAKPQGLMVRWAWTTCKTQRRPPCGHQQMLISAALQTSCNFFKNLKISRVWWNVRVFSGCRKFVALQRKFWEMCHIAMTKEVFNLFSVSTCESQRKKTCLKTADNKAREVKQLPSEGPAICFLSARWVSIWAN